MTFTEQIYDQINSLSPLSTDDFSIHWLGQSRSYYSSNKTRGLEASNSALVKLMNKLLEQRDVLMTKNSHQFLVSLAQKYEVIANRVGKEIAHRSIKSNLAHENVRMLHRIIAEINEEQHPSYTIIICCFSRCTNRRFILSFDEQWKFLPTFSMYSSAISK